MIPTYLGVLVPTEEHADWVRNNFPYPDLYVTTYNRGFTGKRLHALVVHSTAKSVMQEHDLFSVYCRLAPDCKVRHYTMDLRFTGRPDETLIKLFKFLHESYGEHIGHETKTCPK